MTDSTPARWHAWLHAARPKTLMAGICPVVIGTSLAMRDGRLHLPSALAALLGAVAIQMGTNFCNDYCDFLQGADTAARKGPKRAVQAGWISPTAMLTATVGVFGLALLVSAYLIARAGWPIAVIGGLSVLFGVLYTAGRYSLAYLGLGDVFVLVFFGPVAVAGTYYVQALECPWPVIWAGLAPGWISVGILVVNNLRDIDEDRAAGKRTLAVRFGASFARWEYLGGILAAAVIPVVLWLSAGWSVWILLASAALIPGLLIAAALWSQSGTALNPRLGQTAALLLGYTLTFSLISSVAR